MKTKLLTIFLKIMIVPVVMGQYVYDYQAIYPVNPPKTLSSKNFTFTKVNLTDNNEISYSLVSTTTIKENIQALTPMLLNKNFEIIQYRHYIHSSIENIFLTAKDVISTIDGGYVVCGDVKIKEENKKAFIAKFDFKYNLTWYFEYPEITSLNAIVEANNANSKVNYIACGFIEDTNARYGNGVIIGITKYGIPIWKLVTLTPGKSDKTLYNDIKGTRLSTSTTELFAATGNAITSPYRDKNVLVTLLDIEGNVYFSNLYGLFNDGGTIYDEEAYGLDFITENQIAITGRCKQTFEMLPAIVYDDVLVFSIDIKGNLLWASRFDIPENNVSGEYGRKIVYHNNQYLISGYYRGYAFNNNSSVDAFVAAFSPKYRSIPIRVYGDSGDDYFYAQEINLDYDGLISAGYSNSFYDNTNINQSYYPYVVESYKTIQKPCHSKWYNTPNIPMELKSQSVKYLINNTKYQENKLIEVDYPVYHKIICPKIPLSIDTAIVKTKINKSEENNSIKVISVNNTQLKITNVESNTQYKILSINGNILQQGNLNDNLCDISNLKQGMYFISIKIGDKFVTLKFVK